MRITTAACLVVMGLACTNTPADAQRPNATARAGSWWLSLPVNQRSQFIAGVFDCYTYEFKGPDRYDVRSFDEYAKLVTKYYQDTPANQSRSIVEALHEFRDQPHERRASGGQVNNEEHSYFDGLYWRQIYALGGWQAQAAFVDGYVSCNAELMRSKRTPFSKMPEEYRQLITRWYGFDEKTG